jgi:hypothetical protein
MTTTTRPCAISAYSVFITGQHDFGDLLQNGGRTVHCCKSQLHK